MCVNKGEIMQHNILTRQLANTLAADAAPEPTRQAAGLVLKNALHAKDPKRKHALATTWLHTDPAAKLQIKKTDQVPALPNAL